jgi:hypothetical protein
MNYDNIHEIIGCWISVQSTSNDPFTREIIGNNFKENLSILDLDPVSRNLIDVVFSMDYEELVNHINSLDLDEEDIIQILSELEDM